MNLMVGDQVIVGANNSKIESLFLPSIRRVGDYFLDEAQTIRHINMPDLISTGISCFRSLCGLKNLEMPSLIYLGDGSFNELPNLTKNYMPNLRAITDWAMWDLRSLEHNTMPNLKELSSNSFGRINTLDYNDMPILDNMSEELIRITRRTHSTRKNTPKNRNQKSPKLS